MSRLSAKDYLWREAELAVGDIRREVVERAAYGREVTKDTSMFEALYGHAAAQDVPTSQDHAQQLSSSAPQEDFLRGKLDDTLLHGKADEYRRREPQERTEKELFHPKGKYQF